MDNHELKRMLVRMFKDGEINIGIDRNESWISLSVRIDDSIVCSAYIHLPELSDD